MITQAELHETLDYYFEPLFQMIGGGLALVVVALAVIFVIKPFIRRK